MTLSFVYSFNYSFIPIDKMRYLYKKKFENTIS